MKQLFIIAATLLICSISYSQHNEFLNDTHDGKIYKTVKIGERIWMAENLETKTFQNGDIIPEASTKEQWENAAKSHSPVWAYSIIGEKRIVYNFYAIQDKRGLAPAGWRVSSSEDWNDLVSLPHINDIDTVSLSELSVKKANDLKTMLKSDELKIEWKKSPPAIFFMSRDGWGVFKGIDLYGFSAIPLAFPLTENTYKDKINYASWWTSSVDDLGYPIYVYLSSKISIGGTNGSYSLIGERLNYETRGLGVRCVKLPTK